MPDKKNRSKGIKARKRHYFKKGNVPHNKGKTYKDETVRVRVKSNYVRPEKDQDQSSTLTTDPLREESSSSVASLMVLRPVRRRQSQVDIKAEVNGLNGPGEESTCSTVQVDENDEAFQDHMTMWRDSDASSECETNTMGRRSSPRIRAAAAAATQNQSNHGPRRRPDIDLMMECNDDDLSPYQINALKRAQEEHEKANALIKEARAKAVLAQQQQTMIMTHTAPQLQVTGIQQQRQMPNLQQQKNVVSPTKASLSDDVIVIGETRPPNKTSPAVSKVTNPGRQVTPTMPTLTRPSVSQQATKGSPIPQQVYKFINIQNTNANIAPGQWVIRPLVPVVPQQQQQQQQQKQQVPQPPTLQRAPVPIQQLAAKSPTADNKSEKPDANIISGTFGFGIKRQPGYTGGDEIAKKKPRQETDEKADNWVPLEDYYYGKKEGDVSYTEEKGEYRFKCWYCSKMLYNNVRTMQHLQGHIDSGKQQNLDLSDLTQCKHCYKQFDTPFEMQTHMEKVHLSTKVLMCRICEKDQDTYGALGNHMKQCHMACEMPYVCQLCNFRSSMYSDVVDHFKKKHDSSQHLLCLYCLRIFRVKFVSQGWGQTQTYYGHLLKHQSKSSTKKCATCRLTFFNSQDVKSHRKKDHIENQKETGVPSEQSTSIEMMIKVPESGLHRSKVKSLNAPSISKVMDIGVVHLPASAEDYLCFECKTSMGSAEHYKKHVNCSMCRFATSCSVAYANHMMGFHSRQMWSLNLNIPWERPMTEKMHCLCGYTSKYGNKIANHLVFCSKQTCYTKKPDVLWKDSADEGSAGDHDSPEKPGTSLLDILGLVKKKNLMTPEGVSPSQEVKAAENVQRTKLPAPVPKSFAHSFSRDMNASSEMTGGEKGKMGTENKDEGDSAKSRNFSADLQIQRNTVPKLGANVQSLQKDTDGSIKSKDSLQLDIKTENTNLLETKTQDSNSDPSDTNLSEKLNQSKDIVTTEESQKVEKDVVETVEEKSEERKMKSMKKDLKMSPNKVADTELEKETSDFGIGAEESENDAKDKTEEKAGDGNDTSAESEVVMESKQDHSETVAVKNEENKIPIKSEENDSPMDTEDCGADQQDSADETSDSSSVINRIDHDSIGAKEDKDKDGRDDIESDSKPVKSSPVGNAEMSDLLPILSESSENHESDNQPPEPSTQGEGSQKELTANENICKEEDSDSNGSKSEQPVEQHLDKSETDAIDEDTNKIENDGSTGQSDVHTVGESDSNTQANPEESEPTKQTEKQSGDDSSTGSNKDAKDEEQHMVEPSESHQSEDREKSQDSSQLKVKDKDVHSSHSHGNDHRDQRDSDKRHHDDRSRGSSRSGDGYHGNKSHDRSRDRERSYERDRHRDDYHYRQYSGNRDHQHQSSRYQGQDNRNQGQGYRGHGGYDRNRGGSNRDGGYGRDRNYDRNYQNQGYNRRGYRDGYY
ncbi:hypothetical protein CHS0354_033802 [Potamilus streckersoni]|uniref:C2H2-type domain-containing protein n=1 Tax=Potamilus streckersoni TaxID=2493646 RepID=A0AAE0SFB2_9BIVA|nr:hypothetical protein CHS0354_033802 [Potamilus streckersoni]